MTALSTTNDVLACLADNGMDQDGIFASEWLRMLEKHDMPALIVLICKHRKEPTYAPLIKFLTAAIEAEHGDLF